MSSLTSSFPLEDELGDVLEKALRFARLTPEQAAAAAGIAASKLRDALDYRYELNSAELTRLAAVLQLNELGLVMLSQSAYPLPATGPLPFCLHRLAIRHGIGVANAYLITEPGSDTGVLFDTGPDLARMQRVWPAGVRRLEAIFLTHVEAEHVGGLVEIAQHYDVPRVFSPAPLERPPNRVLVNGAQWRSGSGQLAVTAFSTPGHAKAHFAYLVESLSACAGRRVLICGDLIFAGSLGGGYFCWETLRASVQRLFAAVPLDTVIAPGHGPITTVEHELRFNPFCP